MWKYIRITVIIPDSEIIWSSLSMWTVSDTLRDSIDSRICFPSGFYSDFKHTDLVSKYGVWLPF